MSMTCPADVAGLLEEEKRADRERFVCFHLNARNQIMSKDVVSIGTVNASLVHPREVFKTALLNNAVSVIVAHNHPSGNVTPTREDIELTRRLAQAGDVLGIELLDHIIVGPERFLSMKEANLF